MDVALEDASADARSFLGWIYCGDELACILPPATSTARPTCQRCGDELANIVAHGPEPFDIRGAVRRRKRKGRARAFSPRPG